MIDVIDNTNKDLFADQLQQMWKQRYQIFVETLGWDLDCDGELEIDQFDQPTTSYFLAYDDDRSVIGSVRLIPSTEPHLISDVFPELCDDGVPREEGIWEASRMYVMPQKGEYEARFAIGCRILSGVMEYGMLFGGTRFTAVTNMEGVSGFLDMGCDVTPLGIPRDVSGEVLTALSVAITPVALANLRDRGNVEGPVMRYLQPATAA